MILQAVNFPCVDYIDRVFASIGVAHAKHVLVRQGRRPVERTACCLIFTEWPTAPENETIEKLGLFGQNTSQK